MSAGDRRDADGNAGRLSAGTLVAGGRYQVGQLLGASGLRALYLVRDVASGRPHFLIELARAGHAQVTHTADALMQLRHPLLPEIDAYFEQADSLLLALHLAEGTPFDLLLARQPSTPISEEQAIAWGLQICEGLVYLHGQHPAVIVADLAPSALLMTASRQLKLVGVGAILGLYTPSSIIGALEQGYAAPEVYAGHVDYRGDIYALGALLHRIVTGSHPAIYAPGSLPALRDLRAGVSPALEAAVTRALALSPDERWPDAASFAMALRQAQEALAQAAEQTAIYGLRAGEAGALAEPQDWHADHAPEPAPERWHDPSASAERADDDSGIQPVDAFGGLSSPAAPPSGSPVDATPAAGAPVADALAPTRDTSLAGGAAADESAETQPLPSVPAASPPPAPTIVPPAPVAAAPPPASTPPAPAEGAARAEEVAGSAIQPLRSRGFFGGLFRARGAGRASRAVAATGTVMVPRRMQPARRYAVIVRVIGKPEEEVRAVAFTTGAHMGKADLGKMIKGARVTVEVAQSADAFELPQPRVTLQVPQPGALSEAQVPIVARRPSPAGESDRLSFTFLGADGRPLHPQPLTAEVTILAPNAGDATSAGMEMLTLVHTITVLV
jgi:hypothetical protein